MSRHWVEYQRQLAALLETEQRNRSLQRVGWRRPILPGIERAQHSPRQAVLQRGCS